MTLFQYSKEVLTLNIAKQKYFCYLQYQPNSNATLTLFSLQQQSLLPAVPKDITNYHMHKYWFWILGYISL